MPSLLVLLLLLVAAPVLADTMAANAGPGSVVLADDMADDAPEPPLPKPPAEMPVAAPGPTVLGPDTRELLVEQCKDPDFIACFKKWRPPPPPPPEPEKKQAKAGEAPTPPDPNAPREPAVGGPLVGPPPTPQPEADKATYEALVKAMKEAGLEGKVGMPNPPQDGSSTMDLAPLKPAAPKSATGKSDSKKPDSQKSDSQKKAPAKP